MAGFGFMRKGGRGRGRGINDMCRLEVLREYMDGIVEFG